MRHTLHIIWPGKECASITTSSTITASSSLLPYFISDYMLRFVEGHHECQRKFLEKCPFKIWNGDEINFRSDSWYFGGSFKNRFFTCTVLQISSREMSETALVRLVKIKFRISM